MDVAGRARSEQCRIDEWVEMLAGLAVSPIPGAIDVLRNFGGLTITPPTSKLNKFSPEQFTFDPVLAASGEVDRIEYWQEQHNVRLYPLAAAGQGSMILYCDGGKIVKGWQAHFNLLGNDLSGALELLVFAQRYPVRYSPTAINWWEE